MPSFEGSVKALKIGRRVLSGPMAISIPAGEVHVLSGPNGCGKSLLLDSAAGVGPAKGLTVHLGARNLHGESPASRWRLGLRRMFQAPIVPGDVTVYQAMAHSGIPEGQADGFASDAWCFLGAAGVAGSKQVGQLSFGQRRSLELCLSLRAPVASLLDEPFSGMAHELIPGAAHLVRCAAAEGTAVLVIDHLKRSEAIRYDAEHVWVGPPEDLASRNQTLKAPIVSPTERNRETPAIIEWNVQSLKIDGRLVAEALTVSLGAGSVVLLGGGNGAGKSTILRALAGVPQPWNSVEARIDRTGDKSGLFLSPQPPKLLADLTVRDNLRFMLLPSRGPEGARIAVVRDILAWLGINLERSWNNWARDLSGGEAAMIALAGAVVSERPVLLLDEPFEGLSRDARGRAVTLLARALDAGKCAIMTTHDPDLLSQVEPPLGIVLDERAPISGRLSGGSSLTFPEVLGGLR